jgi:predicted MPP superfamily phosphohydrolase
MLIVITALLFGVPWWALVGATTDWPSTGAVLGTLGFVLAAAALPALLVFGRVGEGGGAKDALSIAGDTLLGVAWALFTWTVLGQLLNLALFLAGVHDPDRSRAVALTIVVVTAVLLGYGFAEARRLPRTKTVEVVLPRLGAGLDGLRVVVLTDTHYGPIDRARWSGRVVAAVNALEPDVVCHTGDLADGSVAQRRAQVDHLADVKAPTRLYITGNHEYYSAAQTWLDHMVSLGWDALHNRHHVVERGGDQLIFAGIDDPTGRSSGLPGHGPDPVAALAGTDPAVPIVLLAHQPKQVSYAVEAGADLQLSGHTHGGQMWPFHYLVLTDQPSVAGLSRHGERTQLYTSRGTGFWGPPFRIFAPSEISLLILRAVPTSRRAGKAESPPPPGRSTERRRCSSPGTGRSVRRPP